MSEQSSPEFKDHYRDSRTEKFSRVFDASLIQTMTEEERAAVESIVSIGPGDAIETPLLRAAFPKANITLVEKNYDLASINTRKFVNDSHNPNDVKDPGVTSIHADASTPEAKQYMKVDLAVIRNPNITLDPHAWQGILNNLGKALRENGMLFMTTIQKEEMDVALQMMQKSGFTPFEGEPKEHTSITVDDSYTVRAGRSKIG